MTFYIKLIIQTPPNRYRNLNVLINKIKNQKKYLHTYKYAALALHANYFLLYTTLSKVIMSQSF